MAKRSTAAVEAPANHTDGSHHDWEAREAMHTLLRAKEIAANKGLLKRVRKHAAHHAKEMAQVSHHAAQLAKTGHISEKQMAKLTKNRPLA